QCALSRLPLSVIVAASLRDDLESKGKNVREIFIQPAKGDYFPKLEAEVAALTRPHEIMQVELMNAPPVATEDEVNDLFAIFMFNGTRYYVAAHPFNYEILEDDPFDVDYVFRHLAGLCIETDNGRRLSAHWKGDGIVVFPNYSRVTKIRQYGCVQERIDDLEVKVDLWGVECIVDIETPDDHYDEYKVRRKYPIWTSVISEDDKDQRNKVIGAFVSLPFEVLEDEGTKFKMVYQAETDDEGEYITSIEVTPNEPVDVEGLVQRGVDVRTPKSDLEEMSDTPGVLEFRYDGIEYAIDNVRLV
ncbi:hypothetical protein ACFL0V_07040, partial [Nanoarchaeota archaeon]